MISFANLDQTFVVDHAGFHAARDTSVVQTPTRYSFLTEQGHRLDLIGVGFSYAGGLLTGGAVSSIRFDLNNDDGIDGAEINVTGLNLDAAALQIGVGTASEQNNRFWQEVLAGEDVFDLTVANNAINLQLAGDGAGVASGTVTGRDDQFIGAPQGLTGTSWVAGDYTVVTGATATGGKDFFDAALHSTFGDFVTIGVGGVGVGGEDTITPFRIVNNNSSVIYLMGDARVVYGALYGGEDIIDLSATDTSGYTGGVVIAGDADLNYGLVIGGDDVLRGSSRADTLYGDVMSNLGTVAGGDDRLFGGAGDDFLIGNGGSDVLDGGVGFDSAYFMDVDTTGAYNVRLGDTVYLAQIVSRDTDALIGIEEVVTGSGNYDPRTVAAFDGLSYVASYTDLALAFSGSAGEVNAAGATHFAFSGYFEGRLIVGNASFDPAQYRQNYADLAGLSDEAALLHWINNGVHEGRLGFDALAYIASYDDLIGAFGTDEAAAVRHWHAAGLGEGRDVWFDADQYRANYADLTGLSDAEVALHYVTTGRFGENRTFLDPLNYVASHADLIQAFGDFGSAPSAGAFGLSHYVDHGRAEGRDVRFDAWQYLLNYQDLREAFGRDVDAAANHFIAYGYYEGRTDAAAVAIPSQSQTDDVLIV